VFAAADKNCKCCPSNSFVLARTIKQVNFSLVVATAKNCKARLRKLTEITKTTGHGRFHTPKTIAKQVSSMQHSNCAIFIRNLQVFLTTRKKNIASSIYYWTVSFSTYGNYAGKRGANPSKFFRFLTTNVPQDLQNTIRNERAKTRYKYDFRLEVMVSTRASLSCRRSKLAARVNSTDLSKFEQLQV